MLTHRSWTPSTQPRGTTPGPNLQGTNHLGIQNDKLYLGFGSVQKPIDRQDLWRPLALLAELWLEPLTTTDAERLLIGRGVDSELAHQAVMILHDGGFVVPANEIDWSDRYSRHSLFYQLSSARPAEVQTALGSKHVAIVGCGGIGNLVAAHLTTAGVGQLTLVDDDDVELSNLTRQIMFTEADVGCSKAKALQERASDRNTTVAIDALVSGVANAEDLRRLPEADLIIVSADRSGVVELINEHCVARGITWIGVGYVNDIATWGPFVVPDVTGCWACHQLVATPAGVDDGLRGIIRRANANYQAPSFGPVNMAAASLACLDILRYLGGFGTPASFNQRIGLWSDRLEFEYQSCEINPDCPVCSARTGS